MSDWADKLDSAEKSGQQSDSSARARCLFKKHLLKREGPWIIYVEGSEKNPIEVKYVVGDRVKVWRQVGIDREGKRTQDFVMELIDEYSAI